MSTSIPLPIVVCYTSNFIVPAATTLLSIIESALPTTQYHIISLVEAPLFPATEEAIRALDKRGVVCQWSFIDMSGRVPDAYFGTFSIGSLYRILIPELLPEYDMALYLDCDIIVQNDLSDLSYILLEDNLLGGIRETLIGANIEHFKSLSLQDPTYYINSGFLLMNLKEMRRIGFSQQIIQLLQSEDAMRFKFPDQDAYNILAHGKIKALPPYLNSIRTFFPRIYRTPFLDLYTEADWKAVHSHGNIHYTSAKPWKGYAIQFDKWWNYYIQLPELLRVQMKVSMKARRLFHLWNNPIIGPLLQALLKAKDYLTAKNTHRQ